MRLLPLTLGPEEVHVWLAFPLRITDERLLWRCRSILTPEERAETERFVFARHRHQHLLTRALQRDILSRYTGEEPEVWRFEKNTYGKPEIALPQCWRRFRFNLSHTEGLIACAVTLERDLGIDVEHIGRPIDVMELARSVFAPRELDALYRLAPEDRRERFFALWTLKEAYIKARGMGLSIPLGKFAFTFDPGERIGIEIDPSLNDDARAWRFERAYATGNHAIAVAARAVGEPDLRITCFKTIPLITDHRIELALTRGIPLVAE